jgi:hypothetical protein
MTPGIFTLPELADGFRRLVQPFTIRQQRDKFDGTEKLDCVGIWRSESNEEALPFRA